MPHPKHPTCPACKKSLYKAMGPAKVRTTDPYRFCRNAKCKLYGPKGIGRLPVKADRVAAFARDLSVLRNRKPKEKKAEGIVPPISSQPELPEVQKARERLRELIKSIAGSASRVEIGLVLAICTQETGNHAAANILIDEFELDKKFGLQKFGIEGKD